MNTKCSVFLFIVAIIGLVSCKNNDEVFAPVTYTFVSVVNAGADTLNFYLNGTRQNNTSSINSGGSSGSLVVPSGLQNYEFKKAGQSTVLFGVPLNLTFNTFNSVYVTGESSNSVFKTIDTIPQLDSLTAVRFVNAAPDAGNLSVLIGDTIYFKSRAFKSSSVFLLTGNGQKKITIYQAGATTPIIDTTIALQSTLNYTLFTKGLLKGKGSGAFSLGVIINQIPTN